MAYSKLNVTSSHRQAMFRNLVTSLLREGRIKTTAPKAREIKSVAEKLITTAKKDDLHARRQVLKQISDKEVVAKLFEDIASKYSERPGGYTRVIKLGPRRGDAAEMVILELV